MNKRYPVVGYRLHFVKFIRHERKQCPAKGPDKQIFSGMGSEKTRKTIPLQKLLNNYFPDQGSLVFAV